MNLKIKGISPPVEVDAKVILSDHNFDATVECLQGIRGKHDGLLVNLRFAKRPVPGDADFVLDVHAKTEHVIKVEGQLCQRDDGGIAVVLEKLPLPLLDILTVSTITIFIWGMVYLMMMMSISLVRGVLAIAVWGLLIYILLGQVVRRWRVYRRVVAMIREAVSLDEPET